MNPPVPMLWDDDDVARMKRENAVLVDREALTALLGWVDKQFVGELPAYAACKELRSSLERQYPDPRSMVSIHVKKRVRR